MTIFSAAGSPGASATGPPSSRHERTWRWCALSILSPAFTSPFHLQITILQLRLTAGHHRAAAAAVHQKHCSPTADCAPDEWQKHA